MNSIKISKHINNSVWDGSYYSISKSLNNSIWNGSYYAVRDSTNNSVYGGVYLFVLMPVQDSIVRFIRNPILDYMKEIINELNK